MCHVNPRKIYFLSAKHSITQKKSEKLVEFPRISTAASRAAAQSATQNRRRSESLPARSRAAAQSPAKIQAGFKFTSLSVRDLVPPQGRKVVGLMYSG